MHRRDALDALLPARHARAEVLAKPAAARVARAVAAAGRPVTAQEVADALGLHHTAVRPQIAALERAGVLTGATDAPAGRGRPVRRWAPAEDPGDREAAGHRELVRLLLGVVRQAGFGPAELERFGEAQGRAVPAEGGGVGELTEAFARMGFAPRPVPGAPGGPDDLILDACPFAEGVENPGGQLICVLHRGLARGIAAQAAPEVEVEELVVEDPRRAGCRLRLAAREPGCRG